VSDPQGFEEWQAELHGHEVIYRMAGPEPGSGAPVVLLIHGMINSSRHWEAVATRMSRSYRVIAPDLIGHGDSATPRGDYSLGAHAATIRDLLATLGIERATIVGHSLGGGVAMQFFYQFPQRTERLGLISSGGLGDDVSPLLRAAALPGSGVLMRLAANRRIVDGLAGTGSKLRDRGNRQGVYLEAVARALRPLGDEGSRRAFVQTLRAVIDAHGQRVSARDRLYLAHEIPTMIIWGDRDAVIPVSHAHIAHELIPGSRLEVIEGAGHFLPIERPELLDGLLRDFIATTTPAEVSMERWHEILSEHA